MIDKTSLPKELSGSRREELDRRIAGRVVVGISEVVPQRMLQLS